MRFSERRSGDDRALNLDALTEAVRQRLEQGKKRALLIGEAPDDYHNFIYVNEKPYEAVVLGILPPGDLLHMPNDPVCRALLDGIPVYLWHRQLHHTGNDAQALRRELRAAERRLIALGVQVLGAGRQLITAEIARQLVKTGCGIPENCRLTPLAKEILEGKSL